MFFFFAFLSLSEIKFKKQDYLLPYRDSKSSSKPYFIVEATDDSSCIENWISTDNNLISIKPIKKNECSRSAKISVVATGNARTSATVSCQSYRSKEVQLTFYLDNVVKLAFSSSTKSIYIESEPRTFKLIGFDSKQNTFDSLDGLDFKFNIDDSHLKRDSSKQESSLSVVGTQIGDTWVEATREGCESVMLDLTVNEPIGLFPRKTLHVLMNDKIPFKLCSTRGYTNDDDNKKCRYEIKNLGKYEIRVSDASILSLSDEMVGVSNNFGLTSITVIDKDAQDNKDVIYVYVERPERVEQPEQYIAVNSRPIFEPTFYYRGNEQMNIFSTIEYTTNGSWDSVGRHEISFSYYGTQWTGIVNVCPPIVIETYPVLPLNTTYILPFHGGSGSYSYLVAQPGIITNKGNTIKTLKEGTVNFYITDQRIQTYKVGVEIIVSRVKKALISIENTEIDVGSRLEVRCSFKADQDKEFTVSIPYSVKSLNQSVISQKLIGADQGITKVYCHAERVSSGRQTVAVISSLSAHVDGRAAPNSNIPLTIKGGPLQWPECTKPKIIVECPNTVVELTGTYKTFKVLNEYDGICTAIIQNEVTIENPHPLEKRSQFHLSVSKVDHFTIHISDKASMNEPKCRLPVQDANILTRDIGNSDGVTNVIPKHSITIHSFARTEKNQVIKYHDSVVEMLKVNSTIVSAKRNEKRGDLFYSFHPSKDNVFSVESEVGKAETRIHILNNFNVEPSKEILYSVNEDKMLEITGGSGNFKLEKGLGYITGNRLNATISSPGVYEYYISDICTNQEAISREITALSVESLVIEAPEAVSMGSKFSFKVIPKSGQNALPNHLLKYVKPTLNIEAMKESDVDYSIRAPVNGNTLEIRAFYGRATARKVIKLFTQIIIEPQKLVLLPGETKELKLVSQSVGIRFSEFSKHVASVSGFAVTGNHPGTTIIKATAPGVEGIEPFEIEVVVPTPRGLNIKPLFDNLVQGGNQIIDVTVDTDHGVFDPPSTKWTVPENFQYQKDGEKRALINLRAEGTINVKISCLGLETTYSAEIEPLLNVPPSLLLLPGSSYTFNVPSSFNISLIGVTETECFNISKPNTLNVCKPGNFAVLINSKAQRRIIDVSVEEPSELYLHSPVKSKVSTSLLSKNGRTFDSLNSVYFSAKCNEEVVSNLNRLSCQLPAKVEVSASTAAFTITKEITLEEAPIIPAHPVVLVGSEITFSANTKQNKWASSNRKVAIINEEGKLTAKTTGQVTVTNGVGAETDVEVITIDSLSIEPIDKTLARVKPLFNHEPIDWENIAKPRDLELRCLIDNEIKRTDSIVNNTGMFCRIPRKYSSITLDAMVISQSANIKVIEKKELVNTKTNFGVPDGYTVPLTATKMQTELNITVPNNKILITECPSDVIVSLPSEGGIKIKATKENAEGTIVLAHTGTGEKIRVFVNWENEQMSYQTKKISKKVGLSMYICIVVMIFSIYTILAQIGYA